MKTTQLTASAVALATAVYAQTSTADNPQVTVQSCSSLSCIDRNLAGPCRADTIRATGVGIAGNIITTNSSQLSLTLVDGGPDGVIAQDGGFQFSSPTLYVGVPPNVDVSTQATGCALMMQYQGQTFPELGIPSSQNSTSCNSLFSSGCRQNFADIIDRFEYSTSNSSGLSLTRCQALAQFIEASIAPELSFCGWFSDYLNITGGTITGSGAATNPVTLQQSGCQPTAPQNYNLHRVASMNQILRTSGEVFPGAGATDSNRARLRIGAGRSGITPVVSVLYESGDNARPQVQWACMKTFAANGAQMPNELNFPTSGATSKSLGALVVATGFAISWQLFV